MLTMNIIRIVRLDKPYITTPKEVIVKMGKELRINCRVESLVPFSVSWNYNQTIWNFKYIHYIIIISYLFFNDQYLNNVINSTLISARPRKSSL